MMKILLAIETFFVYLENGTTFDFIPTSEEAYQNYYMTQMLKTK
jgi:hypothetical protein